MENYFTALIAVVCLLALGVPGFILIKTKTIQKESISTLSKLILFVMQPCLVLFFFQGAAQKTESFDKKLELLINMGIFFVLTLVVMFAIMVIMYFLLRKKIDDIRYRIAIVAAYSGNVGFIGLPLIQMIVKDDPQILVFSSIFSVTMTLLGWTFSSAIIAKDMKYIKFKRVLLNPMMIAFLISHLT